MATTMATRFEEALTCIDPEFDATEELDLPDGVAADEDVADTWPRSVIRSGRGALEDAEGDYFEQQDALYESASRIALSLVR